LTDRISGLPPAVCSRYVRIMASDAPLPVLPDRRRARGASSNASGRFEALTREETCDGWDPEERGSFRTELLEDRSRSVITRNTSPDLPFDRSLNPYRGCEHGCIYCFARPNHAYLGLSPGLDFETKILVKRDAPSLLAGELSRPGYRPATLALGTNTDPYQPAERDLRIMRGVLEVLARFRHPVSIVTKGALIRRDIDILGEMASAGLVSTGISLTTLDPGLSRRMEPRAAAPATRLRVIEALAGAGIPVRAMIAPVIPGLTDHEIERLLSAAREAGAGAASYILLRLPLEVSPLFREWLAEAVPGRAAAVMARLREMRGGQDYDTRFGARMKGTGVAAELIARRFEVQARRLGLSREGLRLRSDLFAVPGRSAQLALF
jgi:DNA repair photolyase